MSDRSKGVDTGAGARFSGGPDDLARTLQPRRQPRQERARADCRADRPEIAARLLLIVCQEVDRWLLHRAHGTVDTAAYVERTVCLCELAVGCHGDLAGEETR